MIKSDLLGKLRCPECQTGKLAISSTDDDLCCKHCGCHYPVVNDIPVLFTQTELPIVVERNKNRFFVEKPEKSKPKTPWAMYHWDVYRFSNILPITTEKKDLLIFGCGNGGDRPVIEARGYTVYGFDIFPSPGTDIICDGQNLAFQDNSFDIVLSSQVFEHLPKPWVGAAEVARVLRPGGFFVGSVAFMKPYHHSYFHITHDGIIELLEGAGLEVDHIHPAQSFIWSVLLNMLPVRLPSFVRSASIVFEDILWSMRGKMWSFKNKQSATQPSSRYLTQIPLSYIEYHRLYHSPAIVFRGIKPQVLHSESQ